MTEHNGGIPSPDSEAGKALAELEKEGHTIEGKEEPAKPAEPVVPAKVEEAKKVEAAPGEPAKPAVEEPKPNRPVTMVEAWKLKVAEDQKEKLSKESAERISTLEAELQKLSGKAPATQAQKDEIEAEIKAIADEAGIDAAPLTKLAEAIMKRNKPSTEVAETVKKLNDEREAQHQQNLYGQEFDKDVVPLVKAQFPTLPDTALAEIKEKLKAYAFTETYAKVPLSKIFLAEVAALDIQVPKKSSEGKGIKTRTPDVVDLENMSEEDFKNLPPEKVEQIAQSKGSAGWKTNRK